MKLSEVEQKDPNSVLLGFEVSQAPPGSVLNVALVERGLVSRVTRGENGGQTLRHENVVCAFQTTRLGEAGKGTVQLKLPSDLVLKNSSAVAYVQNIDAWDRAWRNGHRSPAAYQPLAAGDLPNLLLGVSHANQIPVTRRFGFPGGCDCCRFGRTLERRGGESRSHQTLEVAGCPVADARRRRPAWSKRPLGPAVSGPPRPSFSN